MKLMDLHVPLSDPPDNPLELFSDWYAAAEACAEIRYAAACCLCTVDAEGWPDGRMVLLKRFDASGFILFSDAESDKGRALQANPRAALVFYWGPLEAQVRLQGPVAAADAAESDRCFAGRPRRSQVTAWASPQSRTVDDPAALASRVAEYEKLFESEEQIPRPSTWQAYRLSPRKIEFWHAQEKRLHHRLRYAKAKSGWSAAQLYP